MIDTDLTGDTQHAFILKLNETTSHKQSNKNMVFSMKYQ